MCLMAYTYFNIFKKYYYHYYYYFRVYIISLSRFITY